MYVLTLQRMGILVRLPLFMDFRFGGIRILMCLVGIKVYKKRRRVYWLVLYVLLDDKTYVSCGGSEKSFGFLEVGNYTRLKITFFFYHYLIRST